MTEPAPGRLAGKVAIITGAGSSGAGVGTGKAISVLFARAGARVCLVDVNSERARETLELVEAEGAEGFVAEADVAREDECRHAVTATVARYGRVDVLVNNVGIEGPWPLERTEEADWDHVHAVNLKSAFLMSKHAVPRMREAGGGSIISISSIAAVQARGVVAYSTAKAGMIALARDIAVAHGRDGVRSNVVAPGHILTPMASKATVQRDDADKWERRRKLAPLGIQGTAWDVAWTAVFLASDEAQFITGVTIPVDGGVTQILADAAFVMASEP